MLFLAIGPTQPDIAVEDAKLPSALIILKVPQKANDVLVDPVLLLMLRNNVRVILVFGVQELQTSFPGKVAPTSKRSFEVHELGDGNVCALAFANKRIRKRDKRFLITFFKGLAYCQPEKCLFVMKDKFFMIKLFKD